MITKCWNSDTFTPLSSCGRELITTRISCRSCSTRVSIGARIPAASSAPSMITTSDFSAYACSKASRTAPSSKALLMYSSSREPFLLPLWIRIPARVKTASMRCTRTSSGSGGNGSLDVRAFWSSRYASCCVLHVFPVPGPASISTLCPSCAPWLRAGEGAPSISARSFMSLTPFQPLRRTPPVEALVPASFVPMKISCPSTLSRLPVIASCTSMSISSCSVTYRAHPSRKAAADSERWMA